MGIFDKLGESFRENKERARQRKESIKAIRLEANMAENIEFERAFKKDLLEVAQNRAREKARKASGLQKLRLQSRADGLEQRDVNEPGMFSKLREFSEKNRQRTEKNMERTKKLRSIAEQERTMRMNKRPIRKLGFNNKKKIGYS